MSLLAIENLSRAFDDNEVLHNLSLDIESGTVTGLLGVNGSGKTTLIHCALGMIKPDAGSAQVFGEESWEASVACRHKIGFVPQEFDGFEWMTVKQIVAYTGAFYETWDDKFVDHLIDKFDLPLHTRVGKFSTGMKQRVSIVLALGHHPELLMLDEPVAALDPVGRRTFIELLLDLHRNEGKTIVFSTHITSDIERIAAQVALLKDGQIQLHADLEDLKQMYCRVHLHCQAGVESLVSEVPGCIRSDVREHSAKLTVHNLDEKWRNSVQQHPGVQLEVEDLNLDEIFVELNS
jgi:ABC-2 type transport system ATP-binding protein